ncbi:tetratricopeptide repeat protein [Streptomyces sp. NPDC057474]|uniref:tetratricopeptide repeat protein n=1 Tax=Streptomyces sp. NPDC057474 TaxID=3346144 RepID=UPI003699B352
MSSATPVGHPGRAALAQALQHLESRAGYGTGDPKRSRKKAIQEANQACRQARLPTLNEKTVSDWFRLGRVTDDFEPLWRLVTVLLDWQEETEHGPEGPHLAKNALRQAVREAWKKRLEQAKAVEPQPRKPSSSPAPYLWGEPISTMNPITGLEVHRAIAPRAGATESSDLPLYVERPHDDLLRQRVDRATHGGSQLVVLVGDSSTGKTRALWEAIQGLPDGWRVWRPSGASELMEALARIPRMPHTVLWLNEMQRYLKGAQTQALAEALDALLNTVARGPVLVVGTLWPHEHRDLTSDAYPAAARLLKDRHIRVPDSFDEASRQELARSAERDPRLAEALAEGQEAITQYLAGGPALLDRYAISPEVRALVDAAVDAARLGYREDVTEAFLQAAGWSLVPETYRRRQHKDWHTRWFHEALADAAQDCRGVPGPLTTDPPGPGTPNTAPKTYRLADYLRHHIEPQRRLLCPPDAWWRAAADHLTSPANLLALSGAARHRARYQLSAALVQQALDHDPAAPGHSPLIELHYKAGHRPQAEDIARKALAAGDTHAVVALARLLRQDGFLRDAIAWQRKATALGAEDAWAGLATTLLEAGEIDEAVSAADHLDDYRLDNFATALTDAGHWDRHLPLARRLAADGKLLALLSHAHKLAENGQRDEAIALLTETGRLEAPGAYEDLVDLLEDSGDPEAAEEAGRQAAIEHDSGKALKRLSRRREEHGDMRGSAKALRTLGSCPGWEWWLLAASYEYLEAGAVDSATQAAEQAIAAGEHQGWVMLAHISTRTHDSEQAQRAVAQAAASQDGETLRFLGEFHREYNETEKADAAYRRAIELGCPDAWDDLAALWHDVGDTERRDAVVTQAITSGTIKSLHDLPAHYARSGARTEARAQARLAAEHGDEGPGFSLAMRWRREGAHEDALAVALDLAHAGFPSAIENMIHLAAHADETEKIILYAQAHFATGTLKAAQYLLPAYAKAGDRTSFSTMLRHVQSSRSILAVAGQQCEHQGSHAEAFTLLERAKNLGAPETLLPLARLHRAAGHRDLERQLLYEAIDAAVPDAAKMLVAHHQERGDPTTAQMLQRWGVTHQTPATPW